MMPPLGPHHPHHPPSSHHHPSAMVFDSWDHIMYVRAADFIGYAQVTVATNLSVIDALATVDGFLNIKNMLPW